jgi:P4 family phage/plasmid primase-like protien
MADLTHTIPTTQGPQADQPAEAAAAATTTDWPLLVAIDGAQQAIDPGDLLDEALAGGLVNACKGAAQPPVFTLSHLLAWPDDQRWAVLTLLKGLSPHCLARAAAEGEAKADVLGVVLLLLVGPTDVVRCEQGRRAAIEAAALFHADALEAACTLICTRLKELGVKGVLPQKVLKEARNVAGKADQGRRDPEAAARAFLDHLRERAGLGQGERPLHYYRHDFHRWDSLPAPWERGRWRRLDDEELKGLLTRFLQGDGQVEQVTDRFVRDVLTNLKGLAMLDAWAEEMPFFIWGASGDGPPAITRPRFSVFSNGMIDLDEAVSCLSASTGGLPKRYEIVPGYFTLNRLPFAYDPDADCVLWQETLDDLLPRRGPGDHRREVLQEFMGLTLLPGDLSFQKFLILVGGGSNGKSTVLDVWTELLGRDNVSHVPLNHLDGEFRLCDMMGKLANIAGDMTRLDRVEEGVLKQLTTGDPIQVNRKHRPPVTMRPTARLIFGTNTLPPIADRSDGAWRRMLALPFLEQIPEGQADKKRSEGLLEELPGIFNWALEGAARLYRKQGFTPCAVCARCVAEHRHDSDPFRQFVDERVELGPTLQVGAGLLFRKYVEFCDASKRHPRGSSEFGKQVLELPGVSKDREGGGLRRYYYRGLDLASELAPA